MTDMKAIVLKEYGGFEALRYEEAPRPEPAFGEVVIRIRASGVNHCDTDVRRGLFGVLQRFPHVMGVDAAGEIESVGPGVTNFAPGDRVAPHFMLSCGVCRNCERGLENICLKADILGITTWGTYAEYVKVRQNNVVRIPPELSFEATVAAQIPFATAWEGLITVAKLTAGETVLVNAAGSGIGSAAVQIAKLAGARVIATMGADEKFAQARALGADEVINYNKTKVPDAVMRLTDGLGVDVAFDMVGGPRLLDSVAALAQGGRLATVGAHAGEKIEIDMIEFFRKHISMHGCGRSTKAIVADVLALVAQGKLKPVIFKTFPLAAAADAHRAMESRNFFGRMVLTP
jgi:NADPH:quinone reductase-like Zn-dependent oxidoreductase